MLQEHVTFRNLVCHTTFEHLGFETLSAIQHLRFETLSAIQHLRFETLSAIQHLRFETWSGGLVLNSGLGGINRQSAK